MEMKVPSDMLDTLGHVTGSIIYDGLKETVTARCGSLEANALTLQFVKDVVSGKVENDNDIAKRTYADRIKNGPFPPSFNPKKESILFEINNRFQLCFCKMDSTTNTNQLKFEIMDIDLDSENAAKQIKEVLYN